MMINISLDPRIPYRKYLVAVSPGSTLYAADLMHREC